MLRRNTTRALVAFAVLVSSSLLFAQATEPATPASPPASDLKLYLMDGSLVGGNLSVTDITVDTAFGPLKIPIDKIKSFSPGLDNHPEFEKKLADLISDLAADGFAAREKAQQALIKMGPEIRGELQHELKTAQAEKQTRLQKILEEFDSQQESDSDEPDPAAVAVWTHDDVIVTDAFTVVGHITTPTFAVTNAYGTLQLKLSDIRQAKREAAEPEEIRKSVTVSGNVINQHTFETSGVRVNRGDQITITATGAITMTPWGNVQATPDGGQNFGIVQPGNIPGGALMAKIGSGSTFKVGSKLTMTADKTGIISFSVAVPGNYSGNDFPGEYAVKLHVTRKP